jgi:hypothetical protein
MAYWPITKIQAANSPSIDAFSRLRTAQPAHIFDSTLNYNNGPLFWEQTNASGATQTHVPAESCVDMVVDTSSGSKAVAQTRQYFHYLAGKSVLILMTGVLGAAKANVVSRIGYFDTENGMYFEQAESAFKVVLRNKTSGSIVDDEFDQGDWNLDQCDGTGPSGFEYDPEKANIFVIDFQWLGAGRVRMGFENERGEIVYCHEFRNAGTNTRVYMTTGTLPIRYQIENIGATASSTQLKRICAAVIHEGGDTYLGGIHHAVGNGTTTINVTTRRPILSIQPSATFNSVTNRAWIIPELSNVYASGGTLYVEIVYGGTLTGASFGAVASSTSAVSYDVAATAISGGQVVDAYYVPASASGRSTFASTNMTKNPLTLDIAGSNPINLSVVVTSLSGAVASAATLGWREFQ